MPGPPRTPTDTLKAGRVPCWCGAEEGQTSHQASPDSTWAHGGLRGSFPREAGESPRSPVSLPRHHPAGGGVREENSVIARKWSPTPTRVFADVNQGGAVVFPCLLRKFSALQTAYSLAP